LGLARTTNGSPKVSRGYVHPDNIPLFGGHLKVLPHLLILILGVVIFAMFAKRRADHEKPRRD
jgi:hypothetical protein